MIEDEVARLPFDTITIGSVFSGGSLLLLIGWMLKQIGPWRKQVNEQSDKLIDNLSKRVDSLELQLRSKERSHFIDLRRMEARYEAYRSLDRHKFNNSEQCLDSLLHMLELSPEKAREGARLAREQRAEQRKGEQLESAAVHNAELLATEIARREFDERERNELSDV